MDLVDVMETVPSGKGQGSSNPSDKGPDHRDQRHPSGGQQTLSTGPPPPTGKKPCKKFKCKMCNAGHILMNCDAFRALHPQKWEKVKELGACFRCLGFSLHSDRCSTIPCGLNDCKSLHSRLLHQDKVWTQGGERINQENQNPTQGGRPQQVTLEQNKAYGCPE